MGGARGGGSLAELSGRWGYRVGRGSSKRGGDVGLLGLVRHLRQGGEVALTPDGPRGPAERMKPGALAAAQHANALVIATGARTSSAWWLRSWDRFCLPRPFAAVEIAYSPPFAVEQGKAALRQALTRAEQELERVTYGDGGDERLVHRRLVPEAVVVANPDRVAGAAAARAGGARVLVLDDAYQLLGVARDVNVAVLSAESWAGSPWPLPAGPWRERWEA